MVGMRSILALVAITLVASAASAETPAGQAEGYIIIRTDGPAPFQVPLGPGAAHGAFVALGEAGPPPNPFVPSPARQKVTFLGVASSPVFETLGEQLRLPLGTGLVVDYIRPDSPATKAGIKRHDILLRLDDQILVNPPQLSVLVRMHKPGDKVTLTLLREGKEQKITAELVETEMAAEPSQEALPGHPLGQGNYGLWRVRPDRLTDENAWFGLAPGAAIGSRGYAMASTVLTDGEHTLTLTSRNGSKYLVAKDKAGKTVFEGLVQTDEQRKAVPPEVLKKLEKLEQTTQAQASGQLCVDDGEHSLTLTTTNGKKHLLAKDKSGKVLFDGPIDTDEQLKAVPKDIREKLKSMNPIIIENPVTVPAPGASPM